MDNGPVVVFPLLGEGELIPGPEARASLDVRSFSLAEDNGLAPVAVPLTQAAWSSLLFGAVPVRRYCNVRPSKSERLRCMTCPLPRF
jgi:hypothetical protein